MIQYPVWKHGWSSQLNSQLSSREIKAWKSIKLRWWTMSSYLYPQFKYMIFHIFICILHLLRVYYELTMWPAARCLDSSVGRALHRYRRGHRFEYRSDLNFFFTASQVVCITAMINYVFISFSTVWFIYWFHFTWLHNHGVLIGS